MRVAVLSDVHGNAPALRSVLDDAKAQDCDGVWFLGDLFGRGPLPITCFRLLAARQPAIWLSGNHDLGVRLVAEGAPLESDAVYKCAPGRSEHWMFKWHAAQVKVGLSADEQDTLWSRPTWQPYGEVIAVHGAIVAEDPHELRNVGVGTYMGNGKAENITLNRILDFKHEPKPRLIVCGHWHCPAWLTPTKWEKGRQWLQQLGNDIYTTDIGLGEGVFRIPPANDPPALANPGSVGDPRFVQGDKRAAYAIVDWEASAVYFRRVEYDNTESKAAAVLWPAEGTTLQDLGAWWAIVQPLLNHYLQ